MSQTAKTTGPEMIRKITLRNVGCDVATMKQTVRKIENDGDSVPAVRIVGIASGFKPGATDKGDYLLLLGEFSAVNLMTGAQFASGRAILPNFLSDSLGAVLQNGGSAEFALEIGVRRKDSAVAGYEYTARPLVESKSSDRMAELIAAASKDMPALLAPEPKADAPKAPAKKGGKK